MNINEHPIYKNIYDLCQEIEKLPASEQATKVVIMASDLEKPSAQMVNALREIKRTVLNMMPQNTQRDLAHIIRLCIDAGITQKMDELNARAAESANIEVSDLPNRSNKEPLPDNMTTPRNPGSFSRSPL